MIYKYNQIQWMQLILRERISSELSLKLLNDHYAIISTKFSAKNILIKLDALTFLREDSNLPITLWFPNKEGWDNSLLDKNLPAPGLSEIKEKIIQQTQEGYLINYDILGLIYWVFNRLEELGHSDLDSQSRFSAYSSHAYKNSYLERPIVDEWLIILSQVVKRLWPKCKLINSNFKIKLSHDVDIVSRYHFASPLIATKRLIIDIIKLRNFRSSLSSFRGYCFKHKELSKYDIYNTFDWIMRQSEDKGLKSTFYFLCGQTSQKYDAEYDIKHPIIRKLMRNIHERGHEIGLHPSYNSYQDPKVITSELEKLKGIFQEEDIHQNFLGSRMHYLRWRHPVTLINLEKAQLSHDSTMTYANLAGFRCGTCREFPGFDPIKNKILKIRIRPLIAMEHTVIAKGYMGLGVSKEAFDKFIQLKNACKAVKGDFTLLWHNNQLATSKQKELYSSLLE